MLEPVSSAFKSAFRFIIPNVSGNISVACFGEIGEICDDDDVLRAPQQCFRNVSEKIGSEKSNIFLCVLGDCVFSGDAKCTLGNINGNKGSDSGNFFCLQFFCECHDDISGSGSDINDEHG